MVSCAPIWPYTTTDNTDCEPWNPIVNPGAYEWCDYVDNNCNGQIDEGYNTTWYADLDSDGYGDPSSSTTSCWPIWPYTATNNTDCDPLNWIVNPGATEVCDGLDNNCDGNTDEGYLITSWYADYDYDGYGDPNNSITGCSSSWPYTTTDNTDCDPWNSSVYPGAYEWCDYMDNNCNGQIDEGYNTTWYADMDGDSYGNPNSFVVSCYPYWPYYNMNNTDCDDGNAAVNPGAAEVCFNGIDDNCSGSVDENDVSVSVSPSGSMTVCHGVPVLLSSSVSGSGPYTYQWYRGANAQAGATDPTYTTTKKGTFYVVVSNGSCVATSNSVSISRIPSPPANITNVTGTNDLCAAGGSITLKANGTAYTYQWKKDGVYTGQTTKFITVNAPGSYTVEVTNSNGCTKESAPVNIISCSERSTLVADASIRLYPNPTDGGQVFLSAPLSGDGPATITVSTLPGQEVLRTVVNSEGGLLQTTLTLPAGLASGTYVVKLVSGNSTVTRQLVLQR
ncbi:MAG: MopE-related protein [Chitinophagales bacterium]|nr:MopE-related protein [Chitinophagales bacterium]